MVATEPWVLRLLSLPLGSTGSPSWTSRTLTACGLRRSGWWRQILGCASWSALDLFLPQLTATDLTSQNSIHLASEVSRQCGHEEVPSHKEPELLFLPCSLGWDVRHCSLCMTMSALPAIMSAPRGSCFACCVDPSVFKEKKKPTDSCSRKVKSFGVWL